MSLVPPAPVDTRHLFRPVANECVLLLRQLEEADWDRPAVAGGSWRVRDVLAHLVDLTFRRLSYHRDRMAPPPPPFPITSEADFVRFINDLNARWVNAAARFSPRVLIDLYELGSRDLADWFEALPLEAPALFGVSWAGEMDSEGWVDVGRELVELWHHQQQIRFAVGAPSLDDPRYLRPVLALSMRGVPHAYRDTTAEEGQTVLIDVTGPSGGHWTLTRLKGWELSSGTSASPTTTIRLSDQAAWRLFVNALPDREAAAALTVEGDRTLAEPFRRARSVIV